MATFCHNIEDFRHLSSPIFQEVWRDVLDGNIYCYSSYDIAITDNLAAFEHKQDDAPVNFCIGICYLKTSRKEKAIEFLKYAYEQNPNVFPEID